MTLATSTVSLITLGVISVCTIVRTDAHQAKSGWTYPPACCKAQGLVGDCQAIPARDISRGPRGFSVFLHAGDHHLVTKHTCSSFRMGTKSPPAMAGIISAFIRRKTT